nr:MAG TPA: hypothetical protein [Caudoviricetes sp.]
MIFKELLELHKDKDFRRRMVLPYISLTFSVITLIIVFA